MPKARYRFNRSDSIEGFMSRDRSSTDAFKVLGVWCNGGADRSYSVQTEGDEQLVVELRWNESDISAGPNLDDACYKFGVTRTYENA